MLTELLQYRIPPLALLPMMAATVVLLVLWCHAFLRSVKWMQKKSGQLGMEKISRFFKWLDDPYAAFLSWPIVWGLVLLFIYLVNGFPPPDPEMLNKPWPPGFSPFSW